MHTQPSSTLSTMPECFILLFICNVEIAFLQFKCKDTTLFRNGKQNRKENIKKEA
jgi:hypothetical protein